MSNEERDEEIWSLAFNASLQAGHVATTARDDAEYALKVHRGRWPAKPIVVGPAVRSSDLSALANAIEGLRTDLRYDAATVLKSVLEAFTSGNLRGWVPPPRGA